MWNALFEGLMNLLQYSRKVNFIYRRAMTRIRCIARSEAHVIVAVMESRSTATPEGIIDWGIRRFEATRSIISDRFQMDSFN